MHQKSRNLLQLQPLLLIFIMTSTSNDPKKSILVYVVNQSVNIINPPAPCFSMLNGSGFPIPWDKPSLSIDLISSLIRFKVFLSCVCQ
nr:MAG TPA: hypothetical protein [Caudoviricetes sp.]